MKRISHCGLRLLETGETHHDEKASHSVLINWQIVHAAKPMLGFLKRCPLVGATLGQGY